MRTQKSFFLKDKNNLGKENKQILKDNKAKQ